MEEADPIFSIIIPTHNRLKELSVCLRSLTHLDYPLDRFEVIVVDDGSETLPEHALASFRDQLDVTLLTQAHAGPAAARNTGASRARGEFLAFIDDDCMPKADWLQKLAARLAETPDRLMGGRTLNALNNNPFSTASQLILDIVYSYYNADPSNPRFFASNNLAIPAGWFRALGGFDVNFRTSEDRELCDRWLHQGYHMTYVPEGIVYHAHALTLGGFVRQYFGYGRGAFRFHQTRARRGSGRFAQVLKFYTRLPLLLRQALPQVRAGRLLQLILLLGVWQVANAAGLFWERIKPKEGEKGKINREPSGVVLGGKDV